MDDALLSQLLEAELLSWPRCCERTPVNQSETAHFEQTGHVVQAVPPKTGIGIRCDAFGPPLYAFKNQKTGRLQQALDFTDELTGLENMIQRIRKNNIN